MLYMVARGTVLIRYMVGRGALMVLDDNPTYTQAYWVAGGKRLILLFL